MSGSYQLTLGFLKLISYYYKILSFESAANAYEDKLVGVILTGANTDGSQGLKTIKEYGGLAIVQDPRTAETNAMPRAAIEMVDVDYIIPLEEIGGFLREINKGHRGIVWVKYEPFFKGRLTKRNIIYSHQIHQPHEW